MRAASRVGGARTSLHQEVAMQKQLLRVGEAADVLAVSRWTIYRWVEDGRLEGTKIGRGSLRVFRASLERLVQRNKTHEMNLIQ
jgi:excisionase family DNA binding protein